MNTDRRRRRSLYIIRCKAHLAAFHTKGMKRFPIICLLLLWTFGLSAQTQQTISTAPARETTEEYKPKRHTVSGYVRNNTGELLINATVFDLTTKQGTTTNEYGFFALTLPDGFHRLRISYLGYEEHVEHFDLQADRRLNVSLSEMPSLSTVVVTGDLNSPMLNTQTGKRSLSQKDIRGEFALLSSPDVVKSLQRISGVAEGTELVSGLYVHGGNNDENLFLLDGTPLYQINHTMGLFSAFNVDMVKNVDFYKSGFPARYGGRLSSVIDVRTNDGDMQKHHGSYRIGLLDGSIHFEGPIIKGRTSYNIGLRRSWLDLFTTPIFAIINRSNNEDKFSLGYHFYDLNAKLTHIVNSRSRLSLSLYQGRDALKSKDEYNQTYGNGNYGSNDLTRNDFHWGNLNAALNWSYLMAPQLQANFTAVFTKNSTHYNTLYESNDRSETRNDFTRTEHGYRSAIYDAGYRMAFDYRPTPGHHIRFGNDYTWHLFKPQTYANTSQYGANEKRDTARLAGSNRHIAHEISLYAEDEMVLSQRWTLNAGANIGLFHIGSRLFCNVDPRAAVKYQLSEKVSLKGSFTTMSQFVHKISNSYIDLPTDYWVPTTANLRPMRSQQWAIGAYIMPDKHWLFSVEGYYKQSAHLLQYANWMGIEPPAERWQDMVMDGRGRFYGMELDARYHAARLELSAAYTLSWNKRKFDHYYPGWFNDKFDNRHKLNLNLHYRLSKGTFAYAAWTYHSGNRATTPTQYAPLPDFGNGSEQGYIYERPNNIALPAYHRLDLGVNIHHKTKHGHERIWNWSVYNAYCHLNTLWIDMKYDEQRGYVRAKAKGYIPIIPSFSYTIKF